MQVAGGPGFDIKWRIVPMPTVCRQHPVVGKNNMHVCPVLWPPSGFGDAGANTCRRGNMAKKMLVDATHEEETRVVITEGSRVEEFDFESSGKRRLAGNIYLAKVKRIEPSLQAAFIDYGGNRHGFLPFSEIHPDYFQIPVADREKSVAEYAAQMEKHADATDSVDSGTTDDAGGENPLAEPDVDVDAGVGSSDGAGGGLAEAISSSGNGADAEDSSPGPDIVDVPEDRDDSGGRFGPIPGKKPGAGAKTVSAIQVDDAEHEEINR